MSNHSKNTLIEPTIEDNSIVSKSIKSKKSILLDALKASEMRYRRLFETAKDGILILDFETGHIVDANAFIVNIIDRPIDKIIGEHLWEIGLFKNKEESELVFKELKSKSYVRFDDMPIQKENGTIAEVEFICNVYLSDNKKVIQCNIRDITERKRIEKALKEDELMIRNQVKIYLLLNEQLEESVARVQKMNDELIVLRDKADESNRLKSAFLANMSHEIRTPLNAIMGFSELLVDESFSIEKTLDFAKIIQSNGQQLLFIINDILDISLIEAGQISVCSEIVDVNQLMSEIVASYKNIIEVKHVKLKYTCNHSKSIVKIKTDGGRIKQVVCNLINNAIKFAKDGEIEFGYSLKNDVVEFFVKDNGIGISKENQALIFQRFRQVEVVDKKVYGGNGLGLSISKALIEKMGGAISVTSELEKGSTFSFTIPTITK